MLVKGTPVNTVWMTAVDKSDLSACKSLAIPFMLCYSIYSGLSPFSYHSALNDRKKTTTFITYTVTWYTINVACNNVFGIKITYRHHISILQIKLSIAYLILSLNIWQKYHVYLYIWRYTNNTQDILWRLFSKLLIQTSLWNENSCGSGPCACLMQNSR